MAEQVRVIDTHTGTSKHVDMSELQSAVKSGYRLETDDEINARVHEQEYGGGINALKAAALGAARGLTFGASDVIARDMGANVADIRELKKEQQAASIVGEIGGMVAPTLLTGGAGLLGAGAKGVTAGVRGAAAVGRGAEGLAASVIKKTLSEAAAEGLAAKMVAKGVGTAAEGTLFGAGQLVSEQALGDTELTAEKALAHLGAGALLGGVIGAGGAALPTIGKAAAAAGKDIAGKLKKPWQQSVKDGADKFIQYDGKTVNMGKVLTQGDDLTADIARSAAKHADDMHSAADDIFDSAIGANKATYMKSIQQEGADELINVRSQDTLGAIDKYIKSQLKKAKTEYAGASVRPLTIIEKRIENVQGKLQGYAKSGKDVGGNTFIELDILKRDIGKMRDKMGRKQMTGSSDQALTDDLDNMYESLRSTLEDATVFGKTATEAQKTVNAAWVDYLSQVKGYRPSKQFQKQWLVENFDEKTFRADPGAYEDFLKATGSNKNLLDEEFIANTLKSRKDLTDKIAQFYPVNADTMKKFETGMEGFNNSLNAGRKAVDLKNKIDLVTPDKVQGAIKLVRGAYSNFGGKLGPMASLENAIGTVSQKMTGAIGKLIRPPAAGAKVAIRQAALPSTATALESIFGGGKEQDVYKSFNKQVDRLGEIVADPSQYTDNLGVSLGALEQDAPETASHITQKGLMTAAYLFEKAPKPPARQTLTPMATKWKPPKADLERYARHARAANDPTTLIDDLAAGDVTSEAIDTVKTLYPLMFEEMQTSIAMQAAELSEDLPYKQRVALSAMFGVALDPSASPEYTAWLQKNITPSEDKGQQSGQGPGKLRTKGLDNISISSANMSQSEQIAARKG